MTPGPRLLRPTEVGRRLESAVATIGAELAALPDDVLAWHPAPARGAPRKCSGTSSRARGVNVAGEI